MCLVRGVIAKLVELCEENHFLLNTSRTKEVVTDFHKPSTPHTLVNIQGLDIVTVNSFKHLGVHLNKKPDWSHNTYALYKKGQSCLHLLR